MLNAFCRVAPSVRFSLSAIRDARFFWRAIVLSMRTCSAVHARRFLAFFAIEQLQVSKKKVFSWKQYRTKAEIRCRRVPCGNAFHFVWHQSVTQQRNKMKSLLRLRNPLTAVKIFELDAFTFGTPVGFQLLYWQNTLTTIMRLYSRRVSYDHGPGRDVEMCPNPQRLAARRGH